jgi:hypothetical protein
MTKRLLNTLMLLILLPIGTVFASGFSLKGLDTGQNISEIRSNQYKLKCQPWLNSSEFTICTTFQPEAKYRTIADQNILSISYLYDSKGTIHSVSFSLPCSTNYQLLSSSLRHKFGSPTAASTDRISWQSSSNHLSLVSQGGEEGVCYTLTNSDQQFTKAVGTTKQEPKKSSFSNDL